jgi:hypothetical protein
MRAVTVGPDQHGRGSGDHAVDRELPQADTFSIDELDPRRCWDVACTRFRSRVPKRGLGNGRTIAWTANDDEFGLAIGH